MNFRERQMQQFEQTDTGLIVRAPAKINLSLLIAGKRADGFHELETVMAKIDWMDELIFEPTDREGIELVCAGPYWAPDGEENLVYRACRTACEKAGKRPELKVTLKKNIPAGTGLGSASSDAAAALLGVNRVMNLGLSFDELTPLAAELGSDVAFFLGGPLAFCEGRGEKIRPIEKNAEFEAILIVPNISVSTKDVYVNYCHNKTLFDTLHTKINPLLKKKSVDSVAKICANMLETSCFQLHPELERLKKRIENLCQRQICLSGSGSALFMIFDKNDPLSKPCLQEMEESVGCECRIVNNNRW